MKISGIKSGVGKTGPSGGVGKRDKTKPSSVESLGQSK